MLFKVIRGSKICFRADSTAYEFIDISAHEYSKSSCCNLRSSILRSCVHLHVTRWYFKCVVAQSCECFMKCMYDEYEFSAVIQIKGWNQGQENGNKRSWRECIT